MSYQLGQSGEVQETSTPGRNKAEDRGKSGVMGERTHAIVVSTAAIKVHARTDHQNCWTEGLNGERPIGGRESWEPFPHSFGEQRSS